jgi:hypothetical protein
MNQTTKGTRPKPATSEYSQQPHQAPEDLKHEAAFFHHCLFRSPIPEVVARRYASAHDSCLGQSLPMQQIRTETIVQRRLDVEAIELALRLRHRQNVLTVKLHILCYLCEPHAAYADIFVNRRAGTLRALGSLSCQSLRSIWKLIRGTYLIGRFDVL